MIAELERPRCGACGLAPPPKPECPMCRRPMEDWPDDPARFLLDRGWEKSPHGEGAWMEPLDRCTFPITDAVVVEARKQVEDCKKYLEFPSIKSNPQRLRGGQERLRQLEAELESLEVSQRRGERRTEQATQREVFRGTDKHGEPIYSTVTSVTPRRREQHPTLLAVRMELNPPILEPRVRERPMYSPKDIGDAEHSWLMVGKGTIPAEGKLRLDDMKHETCTVHESQCVTCGRWAGE